MCCLNYGDKNNSDRTQKCVDIQVFMLERCKGLRAGENNKGRNPNSNMRISVYICLISAGLFKYNLFQVIMNNKYYHRQTKYFVIRKSIFSNRISIAPFMALLFLCFFIGCNNEQNIEQRAFQIFTLRKDSINEVKAKILEIARRDSLESIKKAERIKDIKKRDLLKKNFILKKDEFDGEGWYTHRNQTISANYNRKCLYTHVNTTGYIYLEDQYHSDDWIFHTSIDVKIGEKVYRSSKIETFDKNHKTENSGYSVWENISYTNGKDNGIIKAIAENTEKEIKVRFNGKQYYSDMVLSSKDKRSIKESYEFSELIKKVGVK
jgi:hypothetical protein